MSRLYIEQQALFVETVLVVSFGWQHGFTKRGFCIQFFVTLKKCWRLKTQSNMKVPVNWGINAQQKIVA